MTTTALNRAFSKAFNRLKRDPEMTSSATSAGFIIPTGQMRGKKTGFQVFVQVCRYSEERLKRKPLSGGLLCK